MAIPANACVSTLPQGLYVLSNGSLLVHELRPILQVLNPKGSDHLQAIRHLRPNADIAKCGRFRLRLRWGGSCELCFFAGAKSLKSALSRFGTLAVPGVDLEPGAVPRCQAAQDGKNVRQTPELRATSPTFL